MHWLINNDLADIEILAEKIESFGEMQGIPNSIIFAINLCLDELITNTIKYGYNDTNEHSITIDLELTETEVIIELIDDGLPFNPLERSDPDIGQDLDDRPIGGLGIYLVRNMMNQVNYQRQDDKNQVIMKKLLNSSS